MKTKARIHTKHQRNAQDLHEGSVVITSFWHHPTTRKDSPDLIDQKYQTIPFHQ